MPGTLRRRSSRSRQRGLVRSHWRNASSTSATSLASHSRCAWMRDVRAPPASPSNGSVQRCPALPPDADARPTLPTFEPRCQAVDVGSGAQPGRNGPTRAHPAERSLPGDQLPEQSRALGADSPPRPGGWQDLTPPRVESHSRQWPPPQSRAGGQPAATPPLRRFPLDHSPHAALRFAARAYRHIQSRFGDIDPHDHILWLLHHGLLVLLSHPHHLCHSHWPGLARYGLSARLAGNCSGSLGERRDGPSYSPVSRDPGLNGLSRLCAPCHPVTPSSYTTFQIQGL